MLDGTQSDGTESDGTQSGGTEATLHANPVPCGICAECRWRTIQRLLCRDCKIKVFICEGCYRSIIDNRFPAECPQCTVEMNDFRTDSDLQSNPFSQGDLGNDEDLADVSVALHGVKMTAGDLLAAARKKNAAAFFYPAEEKRTMISCARDAAMKAITSLRCEDEPCLMYAEALELYWNLTARYFKECQPSDDVFRHAKSDIDKAKKIKKHIDRPDGNADRVLGVIEMTQGHYGAAKPHFLPALKSFLTSGQGRSVLCAMTLWAIHIVMKEFRKKDKASSWLKAAIIVHAAVEGPDHRDHEYTQAYKQQFKKYTGQAFRAMLSEEDWANMKADLDQESAHQFEGLIAQIQSSQIPNIPFERLA